MPATWLLLVHQLPSSPTNVRVKTWRRLQDLGAVSIKNSVWALPASEQAREDFEWIRGEIAAMKGDATVFAAENIDAVSNDDVIAAFRNARAADYRALAHDATPLAKRLKSGTDRHRLRPQIRRLEERLIRLDAITFFPTRERDGAAAAVEALKRGTRPIPTLEARQGERSSAGRYKRRTWITRPRPGIDRMSSAWLIRRFIDSRARFSFAEHAPHTRSVVPFDMFGAEFGHVGAGCTFETLAARFGIRDPAVTDIGEIVHDLDLKDDRFGRAETPVLGRLVDGLRAAYENDQELLEHGMVLFEALYRSFTVGSPRAKKRLSARRRR